MSGNFHEILFPTDISYGSSGGPKFKTVIFTANSGYEQRNIVWSAPRAEYSATQGVKTQDQMDVLTEFFFNRRGKVYGFRFLDWNDYFFNDQVIGTGDGSTTAFQIVKTYTSAQTESGESYTYTRNLVKIDWDTIEDVSVGGTVVDPSQYTVDPNTGILTFNTAPAANATIEIGYGQFHVPVRFDTDQLDSTFEYATVQNWSNISLIEVRDWQDVAATTNADNPPVWDTPSGSLATVAIGGSVNIQLAAHDTDIGQTLSYGVSGGALPPGVTLSAAGVISGTVPLDGNNVATYTFTVAVTDGQIAAQQPFTITVGPQILEFANSTSTTAPSTASFTVAPNVTKVMFSWIIAGGAGGGEGSEVQYGGGGGGGGSGGYYHYQEVACAPGDVFELQIANGGAGAAGANNSVLGQAQGGGTTTVSHNGALLFSVIGGGAGANNPGLKGSNSTAPGGAAGTPNGNPGGTGPSGTADGSSSAGGVGGAGPMASSAGGPGGQPGVAPTAGGAGSTGVGYGSGGGGGGSWDRSAYNYIQGGAGASGYVEAIQPSQGASGGTP